jgi:hypothetical protein
MKSHAVQGCRDGGRAYHSDDGELYLEKGQGVRFGDTYGAGDVIGCGYDVDKDDLFFTKNGVRIGELPQSSLKHKPKTYGTRIRGEIAPCKIICSGWYTLRKCPSLSQLWPRRIHVFSVIGDLQAQRVA